MRVGHGEKLSRNRERAIAALLAKPSIVEAAKDVGIGESTLRSWMQEPGFAAEYATARGRVVDETIAWLQRSGLQAVQTLVKSLTASSESVRVTAAKAILDYSIEWSLDARLAALEAAIEELRRKT